MKIAILGYGAQGRSAYEYWRKNGNELTVCDQNENLELSDDVAQQLGPNYLNDLGHFDVLVRSPALHPKDIVAANSSAILEKVTTNTNEFFKVCPTKNIIGVTGTKGKGTTSTLIAKMLEAAGKKVHLGGNIGIPPLDLLRDDIKPEDFVVLELANFQLIDLKFSPHVAVCLMVVMEHMDWHTDLDEYIAAKQQLFRWQKPDDIAIYYSSNENSAKVISVSAGKKIPYMEAPGAFIQDEAVTIDSQTICKTSELKLLGKHNWQNVCAAVTATYQVAPNVEAMKKVLTTFSGLPHRLELVRELDGVKYYNDSFASAPDAAAAAIEAIPGSKVMIMGGFERNLPLEELAQAVATNAQDIRKVVLMGATATRTAEALRQAGFTDYVITTEKNLAPIIAQVKALAQTNDSVVFSPGFASFDMFKNFEDRGNQYKQAVLAL